MIIKDDKIEIINLDDTENNADIVRKLAKSPLSSNKLLHIIIFPGNPGGASFYTPFADALYSYFSTKELSDRIFVSVVGHVSHSIESASSSSKIHSLQDQLRYKITYITDILKSNDSIQVVLIGHSVGAWLALEGASQLPEQYQKRVIGIVSLFPTLINIGTTRRAHELSFLFTDLGVFLLASLAWFIRLILPKSIITHLAAFALRRVKDITSAAKHSAVTLIHENVARNACLMARDEMKEITMLSSTAVKFGKSLGESFIAYYGQNDGWNNEGDDEKISKLFKKATIKRCIENHSHAFVLNIKSCVRIAEISAQLIEEKVSFFSTRNLHLQDIPLVIMEKETIKKHKIEKIRKTNRRGSIV
jgi:pimeloyl-ACP methyl ester carboxylesterase